MAEEKQAKKASFSRKVKEELRRIDFTALEKTFKIRADDEKGRREKLRQIFLSNASLTNPQKEYHLEFVFSEEEEGREVEEILRHYSLHPKQGKRGKNRMVYLKDASEIADVLKLLGAVDALMELENARILKEVSENVNRRVNFEAAGRNSIHRGSLRTGSTGEGPARGGKASFAIPGCFFGGTRTGIGTPHRKERGESSPA